MQKEAFSLSLSFLILKDARFRVNLRLVENVTKRCPSFHILRRVINPEEFVLIINEC